MNRLSPQTRDKLKRVATATLATALFKRGLRRQVVSDVLPVGALRDGNMVGEAYTLRCIPAREDLNTMAVLRDHSHPQRRAIEECPAGAVLVIDSRQDARGASGGGILLTRLAVRGVAGVVTDGGFRDSAEIALLDMPSFHRRPSAAISLAMHQAIDANVPIGCGDAPVFPGDVMVGDADGVIVIPAAMADAVADEAVEMTAYEDFVIEQVRGGQMARGLYPPTDETNLERFAIWRKQHGR